MPCLPAADASQSHGFGLCVAPCDPDLGRDCARHAGSRDHHFRLKLEEGHGSERPRVGPCLRVPLGKFAFRTKLCIRARRLDHSGALEASAVVLGLRRLARCVRLHNHRGCFLVDAQAVLGALRKGRTSAQTLRHPVRQAGALALACGWRWHYGYLPSESNPADAPSRGVRARRQPIPGHASRGTSVIKLMKVVRDERRFLRRLRRSRCGSEYDGCCCWPSSIGSDSFEGQLGSDTGTRCAESDEAAPEFLSDRSLR